jgi:hypothetical protein
MWYIFLPFFILYSFSFFPVEAMQRVEAIKLKRQAQFIYDRQKKAKEIEKQKDIREVKRDMALIRSPAAGMKRVARTKDMDVDEEEEEVRGRSEIHLLTMLSIWNCFNFCGNFVPFPRA